MDVVCISSIAIKGYEVANRACSSWNTHICHSAREAMKVFGHDADGTPMDLTVNTYVYIV